MKREMAAGHQRLVWNPALSLAPKDFDFSDPEVARIKAAIETWDSYGANADRRWLQPLVETLFSAELPQSGAMAEAHQPGSHWEGDNHEIS